MTVGQRACSETVPLDDVRELDARYADLVSKIIRGTNTQRAWRRLREARDAIPLLVEKA